MKRVQEKSSRMEMQAEAGTAGWDASAKKCEEEKKRRKENAKRA